MELGVTRHNCVVLQVKLTQGFHTKFDVIDLAAVLSHRWFAHRIGGKVYAATKAGGKQVYLHRLLMSPPEGYQVDHVNGDGLDNRRCNLRLCTRQQNNFNSLPRGGCTSIYKGVVFYKRLNKWGARIKHNGRQVHLGLFENERVAALEYDRAARGLFGQFANTNLYKA